MFCIGFFCSFFILMNQHNNTMDSGDMKNVPTLSDRLYLTGLYNEVLFALHQRNRMILTAAYVAEKMKKQPQPRYLQKEREHRMRRIRNPSNM